MTESLAVLITNISFAARAGSEIVVRDLSLGLLRRGHRPIVYSPELGEVARETSSQGVAVIDDLRKLAEAPDIVHGHHLIPCGQALMRFPETPALFVCHAFSIWIEAPPVHFPQIGAYVAVDEACRDRLVHTEGIDPSRVVTMRNAVDLRRIPERATPLRERPRRAIAFGKAAAVPELRTACERLGVELTLLGGPASPSEPHSEQELVGADLVFASARAALESLCCGAAVIVCDNRGLGGRVTSANFDSFRARNFGLRSLGHPVTVDGLVKAIQAYDSGDAAIVSVRARAEADLEKLLDRYEALYAEILSGTRRPVITAEAHRRAVDQFLHENLPRSLGDRRWPWMEDRDLLLKQIALLEARLAEVRDQSRVILEQGHQLSTITTSLQAEQAEAQRLREALATAQIERDRLAKVLNSRSATGRRFLFLLRAKARARRSLLPS